MGEQGIQGKPPNELFAIIEKWIDENMSVEAAKLAYGPKDKAEWLERLRPKSPNKTIKNVDQGCALAGQLYYLLQLSRLAHEKSKKEIKALKQSISEVNIEMEKLSKSKVEVESDLKDLIKEEVKSIVPQIIAGIQSEISGKLVLPNESDILPTTVPEQVKHKLMIEDQSGGDLTENLWTTVVKADARKRLHKVPVSNSYYAKNGTVTMTFPSAESRDEAADLLKSEYKISTKSEPFKLLSPKIKLLDVSPDIFEDSDEDIIDNILSTNPAIRDLVSDGGKFKVIFKKKEDGIIVIETTANIRHAIQKINNRIYLGLQHLYVRDHIHLDQCYHCQSFGHYAGSDFCKFKDKKNTCFYCASEDHKSKNCTNKKTVTKHRCINCIREGRAQTRHKATDPLCPTVITESLRIYARTDGMDSQSKNSYLKMLERLRQKRRLV